MTEKRLRGFDEWNHHLIGETHPRAKLTDEQVAEIRRRHKENGESYAELGRAFGISLCHAKRICDLTRRRATAVILRLVDQLDHGTRRRQSPGDD